MYALYLAPTEESVQTYPVPKCFFKFVNEIHEECKR